MDAIRSESSDRYRVDDELKYLDHWLQNQPVSMLKEVMDEVRVQLVESDPNTCTDEVLRNHILFIQQAEVYLLLKHAIMHGDIGLLTHFFARATILFHGSSKTNYQFETLDLFWLTATDASSDELKKAILVNSLVNLQGKEKKFVAIDLHLELLNGWMKKIIRDRRDFINIEYLFEYSTRFATTVRDQLAWMDKFYDRRRNTKHSVVDPGPDELRLARELQKGMEFPNAKRATNLRI